MSFFLDLRRYKHGERDLEQDSFLSFLFGGLGLAQGVGGGLCMCFLADGP